MRSTIDKFKNTLLFSILLLLIAGCGSSSVGGTAPSDTEIETDTEVALGNRGQFTYAVTNSTTGDYLVTRSSSPDSWTDWQLVDSNQAISFDTTTPPVLVTHEGELYLYGKSDSGNIYKSTLVSTLTWSEFEPVFAPITVSGDFSIALTAVPGSQSSLIEHLVYSENSTCKYFVHYESTKIDSKDWNDCYQISIGNGKRFHIGLAMRLDDQIKEV